MAKNKQYKLRIYTLLSILQILFFIPFKIFSDVYKPVSLIFIMLNLILFLIVYRKELDNKFYIILFFIMIVKSVLIYVDIDYSHVIKLVHSGGDSEGFFETAVYISEDLSRLSENLYGLTYTKFLGILYRIIGVNRYISQYLNVVFITISILIVENIMDMINIKKEYKNMLLVILSLFPNLVIISSILLRESFIILFVSLSLYYFIKWYSLGKVKYIILTLLTIFLAGSFHSGVLSLLVGYFIGFIFYTPNEKKFKLDKYTLYYLVIILGIFLIFRHKIIDIFNRKLGRINNISNLSEIYFSARGESAYLKNINTDNKALLLIFIPIKAIYFLISPLPWDWRGIKDAITFFLDSTLYLYYIIITIKYRREIIKDNLAFMLFMSSLAFIILFGISVSNAGTALRHRLKVISLVIVQLAYIKSLRGKEIEYDI